MIRTRRRQGHKLLDEINITPFCDVLLVLLIIFMVTAQVLNRESAQDIKLPKASTPEATFPQVLTVRITRDQQILVNNQPVDFATLGQKIQEVHDREKVDLMVVKADKSVPYELVYAAMDVASTHGISEIALAGERPD